ncbi:unnamed protein product [Bursaphelenchus okinawaensis]|uniref:High-affinity choline transporter 1 n=1 Tax=Bursaphelenchus okinawaensis TaxID=465554 RepID=A0A811LB63_9BILA|nr:unnamed protein product [Bursaphelenchus okinawaensis]CAG9119850.1 unnamed protein product [Bursaphelenchus okinawaensis]
MIYMYDCQTAAFHFRTEDLDSLIMADWLGISAIFFFYIVILVVGIWAGKKADKSKTKYGEQVAEIMLAGRNIGSVVGIFTMTATWVGGAYINGTAEALYKNGILGCQAPIGYALSLICGGVLFARTMREKGYITMLDPFQQKYGQRVGGLMFIPALFGEIFWSAAILSALGSTLAVILNMDITASVVISAFIAVAYTLFGGLYAVAYTDVVQLFCIFIGLWLSIPAAFAQDKTTSIISNPSKWIGDLGPTLPEKLLWWDNMLLTIFGGIPWQVYFQRVLSSKTSRGAQLLSYAAGVGCIVMAVPPAIIGAIARNTDWSLTDYRPYNNATRVSQIPSEQSSMVVPLVLQYLTPKWATFIGLGAVSAAVMSSADSSVLSAASMFSHNIWKLTIHPMASESEVILLMRFAIIMVGILATIMALTIHSVYALWYLCADLVYVILFPQLLCVVYFEKSNTYGCLLGYGVGMILRLTGGEPLLHLPALVHYPYYDIKFNIQYFPFKTLAMLVSLIVSMSCSLITNFLLKNKILDEKFDVLQCVVNVEMNADRRKSESSNINGTVFDLNYRSGSLPM